MRSPDSWAECQVVFTVAVARHIKGQSMEKTRTFPLNAWYVAAWSHEVGRKAPLARTICNKRMVFWRKSDGAIAALEDACWHRLLPLSMGWLEGDEVVCRY